MDNYESGTTQGADGFARSVLQILANKGVLINAPSPMDAVSPQAVLRLVSEIADSRYFFERSRIHDTISPACFHPGISLPLSVRPRHLHGSCPFEDDRGCCPVRTCGASGRVRGHDPVRRDESQTVTVPPSELIRDGIRVESQGPEPVGSARDSAGNEYFLFQKTEKGKRIAYFTLDWVEHPRGGTDTEGEDVTLPW